MTRNELIKKIIEKAMDDFTSYDISDMEAAYNNVLEDYLAKCSDSELSENFEI